MKPRGRLQLGPLPLDGLSFAEALDAIEAMVRAGQGGVVFTPNVDHFVLAQGDPRFRRAYARASLSLVDGTPVLWACRGLGFPVPEKVSGSDLLVPLVERAAACGFRVYFLGGGPGVASRAAEILAARFPGLRVAGTDSPQIELDQDPAARAAMLGKLRAAEPDLVLAALGSPKGELWADEARDVLRPAVLLSIGASFDFLVGTARRAPRWLSSLGLEWLFRLLQEPRRLWRRYLVRDPQFAVIVWRAWRQRRAGIPLERSSP